MNPTIVVTGRTFAARPYRVIFPAGSSVSSRTPIATGSDTRQDQQSATARRNYCAGETFGSTRLVAGGLFASHRSQRCVAKYSYHYLDSTTTRFQQKNRRYLSFTFVGPRKLDELIAKEKLTEKTGAEIADIWFTYHEEKVRETWTHEESVVVLSHVCTCSGRFQTHNDAVLLIELSVFSNTCSFYAFYCLFQDNVAGLVLSGKQGQTLLERAAESPFFVQPIFRADGFFMLLSQFQKPSHFLLAYLEDYKMDPHSATPLVTSTIFDDYATAKDVCLVRCDIVNKSIRDDEGHKVVSELIRNYLDEYGEVQTFNSKPKEFHIDDFVCRMEQQWKDNVVDDNTTVDFHENGTDSESK